MTYHVYKGSKFASETDIISNVYSYANKRNIGYQIAIADITTRYKILDGTGTEVPIDIFDSIRIVDDASNVIFKGFVTNIKINNDKKIITAEDVLTIAKWREYNVATDPTSQPVKTIFTNLISAAFTGYFSVATNLDAATPSPASVTWEFNHSNIFERLQRLAYAVGWIFYYDSSNNTVYFKPQASGTALDFNIKAAGYSDTGMTVPVWSSSGQDILNNVTMIGGNTSGTDKYPASGITYAGEEYESIAASAFQFPASGDLPFYPAGLDEGTNGLYYWDGATTVTKFVLGTDYTVQSTGKHILIYPTSPDYTSSRLFRVQYNVNSSPTKTSVNSTSATNYGTRDRTIYRTDITDGAELQTLADKMVALLGNKYIECTFKIVNAASTMLGKPANVRDGINGITKLASTDGMYVSEIVQDYPEGLDDVTVTNRPLKDYTTATQLEDRIKRLEESNTATKPLGVTDTNFLPLTGGTMSGNITMNGYGISLDASHNSSLIPDVANAKLILTTSGELSFHNGTISTNLTELYNNSIDPSLITITSDITLGQSHHMVNVDTSGGSVIITLPAPATLQNGHEFVIKNIAVSQNYVRINPAGTTIDGFVTTRNLCDLEQSLTIRTDGVRYFIKDEYQNFTVGQLKPDIERWTMPGWLFARGDVSVTLTRWRTYYIPFFVASTTGFLTLSVDVTVAAVGSLQFAIYNWNDGVPGVFPYYYGSVDTGTTGVKTLDLPPWLMHRGFYFMAMYSNGVGLKLRGINFGQSVSAPVGGMAISNSGLDSYNYLNSYVMFVDNGIANPAHPPTGIQSECPIFLFREN